MLGTVDKYRAGILRDSQVLTGNPTMNTWNPVKITFTRSVTTVEAFGQTVTLGGGDNPVPMAYFTVLAQDLNISFDNIQAENPSVIPVCGEGGLPWPPSLL